MEPYLHSPSEPSKYKQERIRPYIVSYGFHRTLYPKYSLYIMSGFYNRDGECLQSGTDWVFKYSGLRFVCKGLSENKQRLVPLTA